MNSLRKHWREMLFTAACGAAVGATVALSGCNHLTQATAQQRVPCQEHWR